MREDTSTLNEEALKLAYELDKSADEILDGLFKSGGEAGSVLWNIKVGVVEEKKNSADMIRKLVAELDKHQNKSLDELMKWQQELDKQGEPVAWMEYIQDEEWEVWYVEPTGLPKGHSYKPLYTTPQTKPLSDEEIDSLNSLLKFTFDPINREVNVSGIREFARAIEERHGIK